MTTQNLTRAALWASHEKAWRDPADVLRASAEGSAVDPSLLIYRATPGWWDLLASLGITLLVTREYEHLIVGLSAPEGKPHVSYLSLPHPAGVAADRASGAVFVASTRNPNHVYELRPAQRVLPRSDVGATPTTGRPLLPWRSRYYPGCFYLHDLALLGGHLHGASAGQNAIVRLGGDETELAWWPACVEEDGRPRLDRNFIQLNSIAAGPTLAESFFSASSDHMSQRRPGHRNFPVDGRGVIFGGQSREPVARGLTRPHSAQLHQGDLWVDNSGYGELSRIDSGAPVAVARLPGWTRGLCFHDHVAFVGTSHVIPRMRMYAPGLDPDSCVCGVHAVEVTSGRVLGSITWPLGYQIFGIDWLPSRCTWGLPFTRGRGSRAAARRLFYSFDMRNDD